MDASSGVEVLLQIAELFKSGDKGDLKVGSVGSVSISGMIGKSGCVIFRGDVTCGRRFFSVSTGS